MAVVVVDWPGRRSRANWHRLSFAAILTNDLDVELEKAIQMRRGIGQEQYVDLEGLMVAGGHQPLPAVDNAHPGGAGAGWKGNGGGAEGADSSQESFFFYPVLLSMLLTVLVVFVFIKLRGFLLFRSLQRLFVSSI